MRFFDSGIEWIGEIPAEWQTMRLKYLLNERNTRTTTGNETLLSVSVHYGVVPSNELRQRTMQADSLVGYKVVDKGDMIFNKLNPNLARFGYSGYGGITSPDFAVYYPKEPVRIDMRFLVYVIRTPTYVERIKQLTSGVGEGFARLYTDELFNISIGLPPLQEQRRIADYLDERCDAIDAAKKTIEDEVAALQRLRAATIFKAVTKGLDDGAPMRDSGVEWIGEIPTTWEMVPNHAVFSESREIVGNRSDRYVLLSLTKQGVIKRDMDGGGKFPSSFDSYQVVRAGQMIFCLFDIDETPRTVGLSTLEGMITGAYDVFDVNERVCDSRYALYYYLIVDEGKHLRPYYRSLRKTLTTTAFRHVKMPLPPIDDQRRIADYLDERCAAIDSVIDARTRQLDRLEDYRKALIYAYATGKKEVPAS